jgi:alkyl hydroperoxide reductase subunit AhpC
MSVPLVCRLALLSGVVAFGNESQVGARISNFQVTDLHGKQISIPAGAGAVTVVVFISAVCPVSNNYNLRMNELYREYAAKGVNFAFINANQNESGSEVEEHSRRAGFAFPVYRDGDNVVADRFGAQYTPEAFVIDSTGVLRYHGRIDDAQNPARVQQKSLRLAIEAVMAGGEAPAPETRAFGCTIKRARKTP